MITKNDCLSILVSLEDRGISINDQMKKLLTAKEIPLEYLLIETDSPYMPPEEKRGEANTSLNLKYIIGKIAQELDIEEEEVIETTTENAKRLFGI